MLKDLYARSIERGYREKPLVSYRGLKPDVVNEINRVLAEMEARGVPQLREIIARPMKKANWNARMSTGGRLEINTRNSKSLVTLQEAIDASLEGYGERARQEYERLLPKLESMTAVQQRKMNSFAEHFKFSRWSMKTIRLLCLSTRWHIN